MDVKTNSWIFQVNQTKKKSKGGQRCCVPGCKSWEMEDVVYHTFPKDPDLQIKWLKACGRYPQPKVKIYSTYNRWRRIQK